MRLKILSVVVVGLLTAGSLPVSGAAVRARELTADFDGDGYEDLAIGVPGDELGAGAVIVLYGGPEGLLFAGFLYLRQSAELHELPEPGDQFGAALAVGDFDGDGYDDLAVGAPGEDSDGVGRGSAADIGVVHVVYGTNLGLSTVDSQTFGAGPTFSPDVSGRAGAHFGAVLAAGNFDGDEDDTDDLAIGIPHHDSSFGQNSGLVLVMYGHATGFSAGRSQSGLGQNPVSGQPDSVREADEQFGNALAVGDFNDDSYDDLAVGAFLEGIGNAGGAGAVTVFYGSALLVDGGDVTGGGLGPPWIPTTQPQFWHQNSPGIAGGASAGDLFGARLAAGDFDGDLVDDLAIGVPGESVGARFGLRRGRRAGAVHVLYGNRRFPDTFGGLSAVGSQLWTQNSSGILDHAEAQDQFGDALAAGDFNGDGQDDLAIGASRESVGSVDAAGVVHVLFGQTVRGLTRQGNQLWHQNRRGIPDSAEAMDNFGDTLSVGDFDGNGLDELVIGVPWEDLFGKANAGAVHVLYNFGRVRFNFGRPGNTVNQFWEITQLLGPQAEPGDQFGAGLPLSRVGF